MPASKFTFEAPELLNEIQNGLIEFEGEWKDDDSIEGTFRQSGMSFPLQLKKGAPETASPSRPQTPEPPFPYENEEVRFINPKANNISLAGTLTPPPGGAPHPTGIVITCSAPAAAVGHCIRQK